MHGQPDHQATHQALAAFGLQPEQPPAPQHQDIWPENLHAFNVFYRLRTQWNKVFDGVGGTRLLSLRMECLPMAMELEAVPRHLWPEVADGVQAMEAETLRLWREKR